MTSALYAGTVTHLRHRPMRHALKYRMIQGLFDLDELPDLDRRLRLFGHNRRGVVSFHDADHGDGSGDLPGWIRRNLSEAGIEAQGRIRVLCLPRMLGYAFNPLSVFFCDDRAGGLRGIVYQVDNTFGQRHAYVLPVEDDTRPRQACGKQFHVSPFLPMDLDYAFAVIPPGDATAVKITVSDDDGVVLDAAFTGRRRPLTEAGLALALLAYPLMTFKVVAAIYWEALRLWLKGAKYHHLPARA